MLKKICIFLFLLPILGGPLVADDLDGGIALDDLVIEDKLDSTLNIEFIKRNARSKALRGADKGQNQGCNGVGNQTFGPGANLQGATIINLSDNKGTTSVCTK
ncbi:MAG: hypothetical protein ACRERV_02440 [Methylococcales bacterium]